MGRAISDPNKSPADLSNLVSYREFVQKIGSFLCVYHSDEDTLFFRPKQPQPAVSIDWNGELWFRIDPITNSFVGIEIENFETVFLKKYPKLAPIWKEAKPSCTHRYKAKNGTLVDSFMRILLDFLSELFENNPQQLKMHESLP